MEKECDVEESQSRMKSSLSRQIQTVDAGNIDQRKFVNLLKEVHGNKQFRVEVRGVISAKGKRNKFRVDKCD
jgi:hypothetical protein